MFPVVSHIGCGPRIREGPNSDVVFVAIERDVWERDLPTIDGSDYRVNLFLGQLAVEVETLLLLSLPLAGPLPIMLGHFVGDLGESGKNFVSILFVTLESA